MNINRLINELLDYGVFKSILDPENFDYCANILIDEFQQKEFTRINTDNRPIEDILDDLSAYAFESNIIDSNDVVTVDNFKAKIIDFIIDKPKAVIDKFYSLYTQKPSDATKYLYKLSIDTNYIQTKRIAQNVKWSYKTEYGEIILTINVSKPEKDPKLIALQRNIKSNTYPLCKLCKENQGYRGHINYDSRSNMRLIPVNLNNEKWYFQFSPYSYFDEHSIVLSKDHTPMKVDEDTFRKLIDFIDYFPEYFVGSNAGLPIVGGSILNHEHFQSGRYHFPIEDAKEEYVEKTNDVEVYKLYWPLSTIRIKSENKEKIILTATKILIRWQEYHNQELLIINSKDNLHNTITPILRKENNNYVFDLILRSNYTNENHPDGVFHPHQELHNLKKENIGLIEAIGLGVLPSRLKGEFELIKAVLKGNKDKKEDQSLLKHLNWIKKLESKYSTNLDIDKFILDEAGELFSQVLKDSGVFKMDEIGQKEFLQFIKTSLKD